MNARLFVIWTKAVDVVVAEAAISHAIWADNDCSAGHALQRRKVEALAWSWQEESNPRVGDALQVIVTRNPFDQPPHHAIGSGKTCVRFARQVRCFQSA